MPKFPKVKVCLTGSDSNAFVLLGLCSKAAKKAKVDQKEIDAFISEATSGDFEHLLRTAAKYFDVN